MIFRENGRSVLPVKVSVDNVHSGGGQNRAGVSLFQYQSHGDLRLVIGCEGYEHAVFHGAADLGGTGFRTGGDHAVLEGTGHRAAVGGVAKHTLFHSLQGGIADVQGVEGFCVASGDDLRVVIGFDTFQKMGGVMLAAGDKSSNVVGKLQRGIFLIGLAESCPRGLILAAFIDGLPACAFTDLDAGGLRAE